ncbi:class I SAM-dependent methyltransferase [Vibrio rhizosphaerae]|uniref:Class I SAM-dependent methyltransferase n=1 Tax=Vibrio rhizosphaerae TaxID=398736 RepID=A0ABU4J008_9VIBR|nr:class I SAM-dependent methyltransferase [Vibrio rhizosphaerae]MDW6094478.1 class I SAM-dependent methyltransferase [Vibrio rhizosphaerae]
MTESARKFDNERASEYAVQSRIGLAGYDACHDLSACLLSAIIGAENDANILVVGAGGTAQEIIAASKLGAKWKFTAVDPSESMLQLSIDAVEKAGLTSRTRFHLGYLRELETIEKFDAAMLIGVIHHLNGINEKKKILSDIAAKLKPKAPFIMAGNRFPYASKPQFLKAWGELWRINGASPEEVESKQAKILKGADPIVSNEAAVKLLEESGFIEAEQFFSSLFWSAWLTQRTSHVS